MKFWTLILYSIYLTSCAGPTNPFGADVLISEHFVIDKSFRHEDIKVDFSPKRQYYNSPYDLKIKIQDPNFDINKFKYEIVYNNKRLNRWFKSEDIKIPKNKKEPIEIHFNNLSILPGNINKIAFLYYPVGSNNPIVHSLEVPECIKDINIDDLTISPFDVSQSLEDKIITISKKYNQNPSLIAALIAQESSFKPEALSYAKALGLTQVTPAAHKEIQRFKEDWSIYPKFEKMPFYKLKTKVLTAEINKDNDWRLNPDQSIEGGLLYLKYLNNYWSTPEKKEILASTFKDDIPELDILLASYNSGAYRVKKAIVKNKSDWLFDKNLNEARKYVMNIKSYCYAFNKGNINAR